MLLKRSLPKVRWQYWIKPWQQVDWLLFCLAVAVSMFGGLMILSTELNKPVTDWWWHWLMTGIGSIIKPGSRVRSKKFLKFIFKFKKLIIFLSSLQCLF